MSPSAARPLSPGAGSLRVLTHLRWWAALAVFAVHLNGFMPLPGILGTASSYGYTSVEFFFLLSGFVLAWSARPGQRLGSFYWRRFARIYPSHLVVLLALIPLGAISGMLFTDGFQPSGLLAALVLFQAWLPRGLIGRISPTSWSLCCEALFYLLFPILLAATTRSRLARHLLLAGWFIATLAVTWAVAAGAVEDWRAYYNPLLRLPEFGVGVALGVAARDRSRSEPGRWLSRRASYLALTVLALVLPIFVMACLDGRALSQTVANALLLGPFACAIWMAAGAELDGRLPGWVTGRRAVWFGEVSFALYLVHAPVMLIMAGHGWVPPQASVAPTLLAVALALTSSMAASALLHHLVERPAQRWLSAMPARRRPARPIPDGV